MRKPNVQRLVKRRDIAGLTEALDYRDDYVDSNGRVSDLGAGHRLLAVRGLAGLGEEVPAQPFAKALVDSDWEVRHAAVAGLAGRSDPDLGAALARAIARWPDDDPTGRRGAELALSRLEAPELGTALVDAILETPRDPVPVGELLRDLLDTAHDPDEERRCVVRLVDALREDAIDLRRRARVVLEWLGSRAVEPLILAVGEGSRRPELALALGRTRDRRASPALVELLDDPEDELRREAARGLAEIADPRTIDALMRACDDDDYEVRTASIAAVNELGVVATILGVAGSMRSSIGGLEERIEAMSGMLEQTLERKQLESGGVETSESRSMKRLQQRLLRR